VSSQIEERRAAARFEPQTDEPPPPETLEQPTVTAPRPAAPRPTDATAASEEEDEDSYTARLLKAKKQMWKDKGQK
jgi:hypothetical protein